MPLLKGRQIHWRRNLFKGLLERVSYQGRAYLVYRPTRRYVDIVKFTESFCSHTTGTVNFTHLFPMFCVSIALVVGGKPVIGVIYAPFLNQLFSACKGRGAFLNETQRLPLINDPIPPMPENAPKGCVFSCEWGKDRRDTPDGNLHRKIDSFMTMAAETQARDGKGGMVHGVRSLGR